MECSVADLNQGNMLMNTRKYVLQEVSLGYIYWTQRMKERRV